MPPLPACCPATECRTRSAPWRLAACQKSPPSSRRLCGGALWRQTAGTPAAWCACLPAAPAWSSRHFRAQHRSSAQPQQTIPSRCICNRNAAPLRLSPLPRHAVLPPPLPPPPLPPPLRLQVPPSRWDVDQGWAAEATLPKRFGSFVEGAELFDHAFFAVSAQEVGWPSAAGRQAGSLAGRQGARQQGSETARAA